MEITLDRALYRTIKQMDKAAMQSFIQDIYQSGKDDANEGAAPAAQAAPAAENAPAAVDLEALRADLSKVKGVGEARLNEIMKVIESHLA